MGHFFHNARRASSVELARSDYGESGIALPPPHGGSPLRGARCRVRLIGLTACYAGAPPGAVARFQTHSVGLLPLSKKKAPTRGARGAFFYGESGIRTHGDISATLDFESSALDQLSHLSSKQSAASGRGAGLFCTLARKMSSNFCVMENAGNIWACCPPAFCASMTPC